MWEYFWNKKAEPWLLFEPDDTYFKPAQEM
jgi:hypothetical protein